MNTHFAKECLAVLFLVSISFIVYANTINGEFIFDDSRIFNSPSVKLDSLTISRLVRVAEEMEPQTRPVTNISFAVNYLYNGLDVRGYHLVNILIHCTVGIILYFFLKTTLSLQTLSRKEQSLFLVPFFAALIWLVHPIQTQAVSYIIQRYTSLSALFYLVSIFMYAKARLTTSTDRQFFLYAGCIVSGFLSFGCKEMAVTLPLFIFLYEWFFLRDLKITPLLRNTIFLVAVLLFFLAVGLVLWNLDIVGQIEKGYEIRDFTLSERVLTQFRVMMLYLSLIAFPHPGRLSLEHDVHLSTSLLSPPSTLVCIFIVLFALAATGYMARRYRLAAFCVLWFFGNHLVEGSIIPLELVFEHRNYVPSMMVIFLIVLAMYQLVTNKKVLIGLLCAVTILCGYWTYQRNFVWTDRITFWRDNIHKAPGLARPHNNLAVALKEKGLFSDAIVHYRETIRLDPSFVEAYYNLGNILLLLGKRKEAVAYYQQAVLLSPGYAVLQLGLANALFDDFRFEEARVHYLEALRLEPGNMEARDNLMRTNNMIRYQQRKQEGR